MPSVLVTGAARGIGRAIAERLSAEGWQVYAGVRGEPAAEHEVRLDITRKKDVKALRELELDAVVNNAGFALSGPIEGLALDDLRQQFEVNVVGQVAVTQAVLPSLRERRGRVVFISSVSGHYTAPWMGAYSASKYALTAVADALRVELRPWGIGVSLVEPGAIDTDLWREVDAETQRSVDALSKEQRALYAEHIDGMRKLTPRMQKLARPVDTVAETVLRALTDDPPRAHYPVGAPARAQIALMRATPARVRDRLLARVARIPSQSP